MLESLRDVIRAEATERTWSSGVALARDGRVTGKAKVGDELELEVRVPGRPTPFEVVLNPEHHEWQCSCPSREAVCAHVVAAVLAALKAEEAGESLPVGNPARPLAAIRYLLSPATGGIQVERVLIRKGDPKPEPLAGSLLSLVAAGKAGDIATIEADLTADPLITARAGAISGERLDRLLGVLAEARDVLWK